ncbi:HPP family protein [Candidatus Methanoprimaticola sp. MG2]|uniref:CBS domain-containing protein n=1 Tax=Candidatus Methanoprimaticola sp. MG2 TaxID=3228838 RepID=UPI0039C75C11
MSKMKVRDLMTTQIVTLRPDETVKKAVIKLALDNVSGAPVVDNRNHLLGILSENDILNIILNYQFELDKENSEAVMLTYSMDSSSETDEKLKAITDEISNIPVSDIMTRTVLTTTPDTSIMEVLKAMFEMKVNRLPVVEKGVVVGVISRGDIIFALYKRKV